MRLPASRAVILLSLIIGLLLTMEPTSIPPVYAQGAAAAGDPPNAGLIEISEPDENGIVLLTGAVGAVPPGAQVIIRNLYTEQSITVSAGITGGFTARIYGPSNTPFLISTAPSIPPELRGRIGSLPGGPATILFGGEPDPAPAVPAVTQISADADLADWDAYPDAHLDEGGPFALMNRDSLYLGIADPALTGDFVSLRVSVIINEATYVVSLARGRTRSAAVIQTAPNRRDRGSYIANWALRDAVFEARIPITAFLDVPVQTASLSRLALFDAAELEVGDIEFTGPIERISEDDGAVHSSARIDSPAAGFYIAGPVSQGQSYWHAQGRISSLNPTPGESLVVELDIDIEKGELSTVVSPLTMTGTLYLQPVSTGGLHTNNGWSNVLTSAGLPIDNLQGDLFFAEVQVPWDAVLQNGDQLRFGMRFAATLPDNLPPGIYVPRFKGGLITEDGTALPWTAPGVFGFAMGPGVSALPITRLPVPLSVGEIESTRLYWALFFDTPSEGSRGILPEEDRDNAMLSNRVRFNSPTYILPPGTYPVEPYIANMLPNSYTTTAAPLLPLLFPGGRMDGRITLPDGTRENLGSSAILQNRLSTTTLDERELFGAQSPVDTYRLTTLREPYTGFAFEQYGEYTIDLSGEIEDVLDHRYTGGGIYRLLIAEPLDLTAGVLPGTPLQTGDWFYPGARIAPGLPAEIEVVLRVFPLTGGDVEEYRVSGRANRHGYFAPEESFRINTAGEYVVDYEARYTDANGVLWAASLRGAGVIDENETGALIAHGRRGISGLLPPSLPRPAWYNTEIYPPPPFDGSAPMLYYPYFSGDIAYTLNTPDSGIRPIMQVQDLSGDYAGWLRGTLSDYVSPSGEGIAEAARQDSLPLLLVLGGPASPLRPGLLPDLIANQAYGYISAVRPGVSVRQFVHANDDTDLSLGWDADDVLNRQLGAGVRGAEANDYTFLFGGAVVRNAEAGVQDASIYAALGVTLPAEGDAFGGARVYPPYRGLSGGPDSGPLLRLRGLDYEAFFHPTGAGPGDVLLLGDRFSIAGQVAPTLGSSVEVTITAPSGAVRSFIGLTNAIGYFHDPSQDFAADEVGVWTVEIQTRPAAETSVGAVPPPLPAGGIVGTADGVYNVYVTREDSEPLVWNRVGDIDATTAAGGLFNFTVNIPQGWTETEAYVTVTMPGYVLDNQIIRSTPSTASYQYSPPALAQAGFPLESSGRGDGPFASDVVSIVFAVRGLDAGGEPSLATRSFTFFHNRILSLDSEGLDD